MARLFISFLFLLLLAQICGAVTLHDYRLHLKQSITALNTLAQTDEDESVDAYARRDAETVNQVRALLPPKETVDFQNTHFEVDNTWLHKDFEKYQQDLSQSRYELLQRITERLGAIEERVADLESPAATTEPGKDQSEAKLAEILSRPEYAHKVQQESALSRLITRFLRWLRSFMPEHKPISPGNAGIVARIIQWLVFLLAFGVLVYVLTLLVPRLLRNRRPKKKAQETDRPVFGDRLEPDQSALDLLAEAEALAKRGELRAAIRRAYIALLVELGDRKILSLAQYKTNRDYLRAMRDIEPLYGNVKQLTDSFELHWYGLEQAKETDWQAFRNAYNRALAR